MLSQAWHSGKELFEAVWDMLHSQKKTKEVTDSLDACSPLGLSGHLPTLKGGRMWGAHTNACLQVSVPE